MSFKQLTSAKQLSLEEIEVILEKASEMEKILEQKEECNLLKGKIVASLFYEPSTRTRLSFETAILRLGGKVINAVGEENASFKKGETLYDTIKTIENYADIIVMRHPGEGSAEEAIRATNKPFINAGDGAGEHPTQALLDAYTIKKEKGRLDELTIGILGDLKFSRTVHSLVFLLSNYKVNFVFIAPDELKIPEKVVAFLKEKNINYKEVTSPDDVMEELDVFYVTRVQKERFEDKAKYEELKNVYYVDAELVQKGKNDLIVLSPLPRITELSTDVDNLPQAAYFKQVKNSVPVRMALLDLVENSD